MIKRVDHRLFHKNDDGPSSSSSDSESEDEEGIEPGQKRGAFGSPSKGKDSDGEEEGEEEEDDDEADDEEDEDDEEEEEGSGKEGREEEGGDEDGGKSDGSEGDDSEVDEDEVPTKEGKSSRLKRRKLDGVTQSAKVIGAERRKKIQSLQEDEGEEEEEEEEEEDGKVDEKKEEDDDDGEGDDVAGDSNADEVAGRDRKRKVRKIKETKTKGPPSDDLRSSSWKNQWAEAVDEDEEERGEERVQDDSEEDDEEGRTAVVVCGTKGTVFKCRVCPKVVCLSEATMQAHLQSKGHTRSMKKLAEGRLQFFVNSDGEVEEAGETHAERMSRTMAIGNTAKASSEKKKNKGRQRQRRRVRSKEEAKAVDTTNAGGATEETQELAKQKKNGRKGKTRGIGRDGKGKRGLDTTRGALGVEGKADAATTKIHTKGDADLLSPALVVEEMLERRQEKGQRIGHESQSVKSQSKEFNRKQPKKDSSKVQNEVVEQTTGSAKRKMKEARMGSRSVETS
eukprot:TRINITY_DN2893_c0_g1_i1.p1 TRINITY_DN2893_c0_g1~~TRINITY_DN2893_c0_g1_i1.p1  ORF type:complete len:508 (+),score=162.16 TRINITY_DN2893_c0_g1_i1:326-1849(+)